MFFLAVLHKRCGDCGRASFVPKCLLFQLIRTVLIPFVCPALVLKSFMVSTGTVLQAGGCNQGKGAAEHPNSCTSVCFIAPLLMTAGHVQPHPGPPCGGAGWSAQPSGLAKIFLGRCFMLVGICKRRGQDPRCRNKAKCHSAYLRSRRAVCPSLGI